MNYNLLFIFQTVTKAWIKQLNFKPIKCSAKETRWFQQSEE
jgi:hypothetical protein